MLRGVERVDDRGGCDPLAPVRSVAEGVEGLAVVVSDHVGHVVEVGRLVHGRSLLIQCMYCT